MRVVVLGAGFGGLELTTRLSEELGDDVDVVLIDQTDGFVFGFSKLDVMFGRTAAGAGPPPLRRLREAAACGSCRRRSRRSTRRPSGSRPTPGTLRGRRARRRARRRPAPRGDAGPGRGRPRVLHGGRRVRRCATCSPTSTAAGSSSAVTSTPFKCPPAPSETALLMHDFLTDARAARPRRRSRSSCRCRVPIPPSPDASKALLAAFEERGIDWHPERSSRALDPARKVAVLARRRPRCPTTSSSACRCTGCRRSSQASGHVRRRLDPGRPAAPSRRRSPACTPSATSRASARPKAGVFAEGQAAVVAERDHRPRPRRGRADATTTARGICYLEFGHDQVAKVDVTFRHRAGAARRARRPVAAAGRRQGRVRHRPHPALVRPHLVAQLSGGLSELVNGATPAT